LRSDRALPLSMPAHTAAITISHRLTEIRKMFNPWEKNFQANVVSGTNLRKKIFGLKRFYTPVKKDTLDRCGALLLS
jgi:hypothetical protein